MLGTMEIILLIMHNTGNSNGIKSVIYSNQLSPKSCKYHFHNPPLPKMAAGPGRNTIINSLYVL